MNVERFGSDFWYSFWQKIEWSFQGIVDLSALQDLLLKEKFSLINPLRTLPPNTESKKQVESGNIVIHGVSHKLNAPFIKQVIDLSNHLELNEILCAELLRLAYQKQSRYPETEAPLIAEQLYFRERRYWLYCVLSLFRIRLATDLSEDMKSFIEQYTNELVADGLPGNICKMLQKLTKETKDSKSLELLHNKNEERRLLSEIIFFIYYQYTSNSEDVFQLVNILNESSLQICRRKDSQETPQESNSYQVAYTLTFAILCALDLTHELIDSRNSITVPNPLLKDSSFKDKFDKIIRNVWEESSFQSVVLLAWSIFLEHSDPSSNPSVNVEEILLDSIKKKGSILNLLQIIKHRKFQIEKELKEVYVGVIHDLLNIFLQDLTIWDRPDTDEAFVQLLQLISQLYRNQSTFAIKYWETNHLQYFMRFAGEKVNANLFVHYIRMLASLSTSSECSQHVYHYLKISINKYVNWDHFFAVFDHYYTDFQQSQQESLSMEPSYYYGSNVAPSMSRLKTRPDMRPEDVLGLLAILNLVEEVVAHSEHTRILLYENPSWHVIESLFRLLACPIQATLKGGILSTLAAFAKSAEIVPKIWLYLESSQLLPTQATNVMSSNLGGTTLQKSTVEGGIKFELEEIEARSQEYPETIAFLKLIDQLVSFSIPLSLGSSHRTPGFNPYLYFIRDSIFLKFDVRGYKNPTQQWVISTYCLRIFHKIIQQYDFPVTDFKDSKGTLTSTNSLKSPGFELFKSILTGSQLTQKFFWIFDNAVSHLEELRFQENGDYFEESVQLTSQILYILFVKEELFGEYIRTYIPSIILSPLHDLLLRHRQCVVNIALLVGYKHSTKIPYLAAKIFYELATKQISDKVVDVLIDSEQALPVIQAFVDKLETEEEAQNEDNLIDDSLLEDIHTSRSVRLVILDMLLVSLDSTSSNLAHFLLGYNLPSISDTDLDYSTVSGCFHVIVNLLDNPLLSQSSPLLAQLCYELLYQLCYNTDTTRPTMRYLRIHEFYSKQLHMLYSSHLPNVQLNYYLFNQWAWFLKILTLELHTTSSTDNKYKLLSILFQAPLYNEDINTSTDLDVSFKQSTSAIWEQQRMKIIEILDVVFVPLEEPPSRRPSTLFNTISLDPLISTNKHGVSLIDVKKYYILLNDEKKKLEFSNSNVGTQSLHSQMTEELNYVIKKNHFQELFSSLVFMFDSWKQLIQIILFKSYDYLRRYGKESILYELLETLLKKYATVDLKTPLSMPISTVVITIMAKLRQRRQIYENTVNEYELPVDQLHRILNGIVQALIHPATTQTIRANFYAALLNYLNLYQTSDNILNPSPNIEKDQLHLVEGNYAIIQGYCDKLLQIICEDASSSSDTWRIVAFSLLDIMMKYDRKQEWLLRIYNSGFLANYLNDIKNEETELMKLLTPNPESLKILYVYESKLSFFTSIANNSIRGCNLLVDMGVINQFTQLQIIDQRPEDTVIEHTDWLPPVIQRYNSLLQPILRLILSLLTSLPKNMDLQTQILNFVMEHFDLISTLLKDRAPVLTIDSLNTLKLVTSIFYYLCQNESLLNQKLQNRGAHLINLLINLLTTYCIKERWEPRLRHYKVNSILDVPSSQANTNTCEKLVQDICKNLIGTARVLCDNSLSNNGEILGSSNRVLFTAHLVSAMSSDSLSFAPKSEQDVPLSVTNKWRPPSLSILVNYLKQCMDQYFTIMDDVKLLQSKLDHLSAQSPEELSELAIQVSKRKEETLSLQQRTALAEVRLYELLSSAKAQQNTLFYIIENSLLILWRHLHYYLEPVRTGKGIVPESTEKSIGELLQLKQDMNLLLSSPNALPRASESVLTLLSNIEKTKKPNIIYFLLRQLKDLLITQ